MQNRYLNLLHTAQQEQTPLMVDGAMGTMLFEQGLIFGDPPDQWNVLPEQQHKVRSVYRGYLDAGSDIILTNTFGGTSYRLKMHHLQDQVFEINKAGAAMAREEAGDRVVAGSIGPTGELFEPMGQMTYAGAVAAFAAQAEGLAAGGADVFWIETMSDLNEVRAAIEGCRQAAPHVPVSTTLTFDTRGFTMMGVSPVQAISELAELNIASIGGNCGNGPDELEAVVYAMRGTGIELPLIAKSNAGMPTLVNGRAVYNASPEVMGYHARRFRALGATIIGGCCGSTPAHIAAMKTSLTTEAPLEASEVTLTVAVAERKVESGDRRERRARRG
jgi:methionine synthase I (cobalamin-dependent)